MEAETKPPRKPNPRARANPLSALLFLYMFPIFRRNYLNKKGLKEEDLFEPLNEHKSNTLGDRLESIWKEEHRKRKKYALHWSLFRRHGLELTLYGILQLINELSLVAIMPLAVGGFVSHFESETPDVTEEQAYMYAGLLIMSIVVDAFINHSAAMGLMHMSMKMGVGCCSMIYRKSLRLSQSTLGQTTVGHIINLISNDTGNFDYGFLLFHYVWIGPVQAAVGTYLLYRIVGVSAFSGVFFLLLFIPLQMYFGKKKSELRMRTALRTDERVTLMNEILNGIQVIKMYTWERPFAKLISLARRSEIKAIRASSFLDAATFSLEMIIPGMSTFITIIVYVSLGNDISAEIVYSIMAIYDALRPTVTIMFSEGISSVAELHVSMCRIETFLSKDDVQQLEIECSNPTENGKLDLAEISCTFPKVTLKDVSAHWNSDSSEMVLSDINIDVNKNQLVAIVGPVGSGKSSLFNVILKEVPISKGTMEINGKISYASQETWLFSASVRQNILFGDTFDEDRYKTIIKICGLEPDLAMFSYGDRTIVGEKGKVLSGGQRARINLARCIYKRADIYLLDDPLSAVDTNVGKQLYEECITKFLHDKICILITHQLQYLKSADKIIILDEGKIVGEGTYDELQTSGLDFAKLLHQLQSGDDQEDVEKIDEPNKNLAVPEDDSLDPEISVEKMESGSIKAAVYAAYFGAGGNNLAIFFLVFTFLVSQGIGSADDYFISYWVNLEQEYAEKMDNLTLNESDTINRDTIISVYSGLTAITVALALVQSIFFFVFFMRASVKIHDTIFTKISYATMRFFNLNPTGRILNRFSEDLGVIDEYIPGILADVVQIALQLIGAIVLTSIINPWLLIPAAGLLLVFYLFRNIYLETSRNVKRIEGVTRSPVFSHMTATLQGLSTIRAFSAESALKSEFDNHQDLHSSAWYLFIASSKAFAFWLDIICALFVSSIILSFLIFNRNYYGGDVGLVVTQYLSLTGLLQWGMHQWSELENNMTSVERMLEYKKVNTEPVRKLISTPRNWPEYGKIVFQDVSMRYNLDDSPVLRNLNFTIHPREKVGVVGRTGAGKSSTIAAIFQLYEIEGTIIIDDIDTTKLPLEDLRSKISIIPQEPVLFSGSVRKNLDPFEEYNDETLWNALEQVELKEEIAETPFGLSSHVAEGGSNFSVGQRQLVCLARALIRSNKILIMDEATANVDPQTDALIQQTIRKMFNGCTVITIAHRLHTIMDSDRVLVMDGGKAVEFDHPFKLLQDTKGFFYAMVQTTGKSVANNFRCIAEESFMKTKNS